MSGVHEESKYQKRIDLLRSRLSNIGGTLVRHESFESIPRGAEIWLLPGAGVSVLVPKPYLLDPPSALDEPVFVAALEAADHALAAWKPPDER